MASWHEPRRSPSSVFRSPPRKRTLRQRLTRRPGGFIPLRPSASSLASRVAPYTMLGTPGVVASGSLNTVRGPLLVGVATPRKQVSASRTGAPTFSGAATGGALGSRMTDAEALAARITATDADEWGFTPWDDAA